MSERLVVIGAGMASGRLLEHLVEDGCDYDITVVNAEPRGSYNRILLSPVLSGEKTFPEIMTHSAEWYQMHGVETWFGVRVSKVDRHAKTVVLSSMEILPYDKLVIATGSSPVMLPLPGRDLEGVIAYRDVEDTQTMMSVDSGQPVVVIGGGLLGLEAAAGLAARGAKVTVVHLMGHLMERQLDPEAAGMLQASLEARGITVLCSAKSKEIHGEDGFVTGLELEDGRVLGCDLLVMAVGIRPAVDLAASAGLDVDRAIVVSDQLSTSDPSIFALGECVQHNGSLFGLVAPLYDQAKVLAKTLNGLPAAYLQKSQSTKLKVTGCDLFSAGDFTDGAGRESVVLRDPHGGSYKRLVIEDERLIGAVLYGDTMDGPWFFDLIRNGTDIGHIRDTLIFGPAYNADPRGDPPGPFSAVAAWRRDTDCNALIHAIAHDWPLQEAA